MKHEMLTSCAIAVVLGIAHIYFLTYCWALIAAHSPLATWLIELGLRDSLRAVILPIDFLTSVLLSLPVVFLLAKLRPAKLWLYVLLAVIPGFIWLNWGLVGNSFFAEHPGSFMLGWLPELFALPSAAWIVRLVVNSVAPNNSFKPKPLRGSA